MTKLYIERHDRAVKIVALCSPEYHPDALFSVDKSVPNFGEYVGHYRQDIFIVSFELRKIWIVEVAITNDNIIDEAFKHFEIKILKCFECRRVMRHARQRPRARVTNQHHHWSPKERKMSWQDSKMWLNAEDYDVGKINTVEEYRHRVQDLGAGDSRYLSDALLHSWQYICVALYTSQDTVWTPYPSHLAADYQGPVHYASSPTTGIKTLLIYCTSTGH
ncbi:hypothetical protein RF11_00086 [Thelohanellus kitauei]|uniref:Uncharacterized protein n=1 Tax=Thelohanellus kitauei TaxID=669202 RepID=A0A0C2JVP1_THEKT|nr:hypothetical protein RF11_00086 [Thelohanellus kitauei]